MHLYAQAIHQKQLSPLLVLPNTYKFNGLEDLGAAAAAPRSRRTSYWQGKTLSCRHRVQPINN